MALPGFAMGFRVGFFWLELAGDVLLALSSFRVGFFWLELAGDFLFTLPGFLAGALPPGFELFGDLLSEFAGRFD